MSRPGQERIAQKIISRNPPYALLGTKLTDPEAMQLRGIRIGRDAVVSVHPEALEQRPKALELPPRTLFAAHLISLEIPYRVVAKEMGLTSPKSVNTHSQRVREAFDVTRTTALARTMFDIGYYEVEKSAEPLGLDKQEEAVIELISYGNTFEEIDKQLKLEYPEEEFRTARNIATEIGRKTSWTQVSSIALRSIVGGDIGAFTPEMRAASGEV